MRRRGRGWDDPKKRFFQRAALVLIVLLALAIYIDYKMRPVVMAMAAYQAKIVATRAINDAITEELAEESIAYDNLISILRGANGEVTAIKTDAVGINTLRNNITKRTLQKLTETGYSEIMIPIGTFIGGQLFAGRGPDITFRIAPVGSVYTEINNVFESAGINQTRHQIMLNVNISVFAVIPAYTVQSDVVTSFCVAETVIVGLIPDGYAQIALDGYAFSTSGGE